MKTDWTQHDYRMLNLANRLLSPVGLQACNMDSYGLTALAPAKSNYTDAQVRAKIRTAYLAEGITLALTTPSHDLTGSPWSFAVPIDHA